MKLIIALDNMSFDDALLMIVQLQSYVDGFKINHTLWEHSHMFTNKEQELFIDCKLWDTPTTMCSVVEKILEKGATMTTISTFNSEEVFKSLHQYSEDIKLLGVTYLTSWDEREQYQIVRESKETMWNRHLKRIKKYGFTGIVCSPHDIKDMNDNSVLRICPGITFHSHNRGQSRTTTPRQAKDLGADYAIIGRSVTLSQNPVETIEQIKKTL